MVKARLRYQSFLGKCVLQELLTLMQLGLLRRDVDDERLPCALVLLELRDQRRGLLQHWQLVSLQFLLRCVRGSFPAFKPLLMPLQFHQLFGPVLHVVVVLHSLSVDEATALVTIELSSVHFHELYARLRLFGFAGPFQFLGAQNRGLCGLVTSVGKLAVDETLVHD